MIPNYGYIKNNDDNINVNNRRYSMFSSGSGSSATPSITNLFNISGNNSASSENLTTRNSHQLKDQKRTSSNEIMSSNPVVCQRCNRFEVDLTNTSDDLNAIYGELKASRQVISLLQRQLELLRVEKEGLEKLIIAQQNSNNPINQQLKTDDKTSDDFLLIDTKEQNNFNKTTNNDDNKLNLENNQKMLLNLIKEQLYAKDEEIVKLKFNLKETQNDKEQLILQLHLLEEDNAKLKSENTILTENLNLRDQTIVSLSNEVFEQSNIHSISSPRRQSSVDTTSFGQQLTSFKDQRHIAKLIDTIDAYKKTNELLSNNVMNLTERYSTIEKKEIETRSQCQELEAKCCQIQSKLLSLLKEIEQSTKQQDSDGNRMISEKEKNKSQADVICSESVKLLIKRLLEDKSLDIPLSWKEGNRSLNSNNNRNNKNSDDCNNISSRLNNSKYECDELGFYIDTFFDEKTDNSSNNSSPNRISRAKQTMTNNNNSLKTSFNALPTVEEAIEASEFSTIQTKASQQNNNQPNDEEFSSSSSTTSAARRGNIVRHLSVDSTKSDETRWHLKWDYFIKDFDKIMDLNKSKDFKLLLRSGVPQEYRCKVWKSLIELHIGKDRKKFGPDYYQSLLQPNRRPTSNQSKKVSCSLNPSSKQIELDLLRTLPNNKHFETLDSSGTVRLRRVLTAYSEHNPKVGYCQGMNRLAAVALLVLPEEEAFWCLATIIEKIMPTGYYNDLWLAQVDSSVVMDFVSIKMPNLSEHFKQYSVDLSLFAWFLTIFVDGTPPALFLRLWDCFLFEGDKILFRVALALLKMYESKLLLLNNSVSINNFLRSTVNEPMNIDQFFEIAFEWINPLSSRSLKAKRQHHLQIMISGFANIEKFYNTPSNSDNENDDDDKFKRGKSHDSQVEDSSVISV